MYRMIMIMCCTLTIVVYRILHQMVNHFPYLAEAVSTIKGELLSTQVATQHNRGSGYVHNENCEFTKQNIYESTEANVLSQ